MLKLIEALQKGKELADPATWKNRQNTMNLIIAVMSLITFGLRLAGVDLQLTDDQLTGIAEAVAVILGVVNMFLINATSKKVGI
jgi:hypothetical protein